MSYILDALKKNKSGDEKSDVPDLSSEHAYQEFEEEKSLTRWVWPLVVMILVLTIGVLVFMLLNPSASHISQQWTQSSPSSVATDANHSAQESPSVTALTTETEQQSNSKVSANTPVNNSSPQIISKPLEVAEPVVQKVQRSTMTRPPRRNEKQAATPVESSGSVQITKADLPSLIYTTHIYATQPKDRFVMLNGRAYAEGDTISKDFKIKEILENDLVVIYKGQEFVLPNLEDVNVDN
ncbi:general secretion pathway protein GspB [Kangiella marina]|uniref:Type II secretion system protein GspB C-terminal domain-containing protein n=1 Tax=Kangiella marina TaxID=1079178 RepID=A0ABP8IG88_9GAMM